MFVYFHSCLYWDKKFAMKILLVESGKKKSSRGFRLSQSIRVFFFAFFFFNLDIINPEIWTHSLNIFKAFFFTAVRMCFC